MMPWNSGDFAILNATMLVIVLKSDDERSTVLAIKQTVIVETSHLAQLSEEQKTMMNVAILESIKQNRGLVDDGRNDV